ncbi:MAG: prepilin-type N-terminal cleavage/methylation domain-containing protein [Bacilli bacterium]|nr:MAG: prepilin-type N-terminal cleavage/methylation domain-containing protein [Bacilli bacterium]
MFKMNKKGFTLIELIAVIILLSLILVIAVPNLIDTYRQSKLKKVKRCF